MTETLPSTLPVIIEAAWNDRSLLNDKSFYDAINEVMKSLDSGIIRICEFRGDQWILNEWAKKAVLLSFAIRQSSVMSDSAPTAFDKVPLKCQGWSQEIFIEAGFRLVPGAIVRYGAYIGKNVVIMPSFVNIGSYVGDGSLIDSFATVGSCATVGRRCHISSGVVLAGVLEPLQAKPVILEDDVFVGANTTIAEGILVESGSVIASGVTITASTKIYDRESKEISYGRIPSGSVVVPGFIHGSDTMAAIIVKRVDMETRKHVGLNALLRD